MDKPIPVGFLDLPAEVRNLIYSFLFSNIEHDVVLPITRTRKGKRDKLKHLLTRGGKRTRHLSILQVSKQLRAEAWNYAASVCHGELYTDWFIFDGMRQVLMESLVTESYTKQMVRSLKAGSGMMDCTTHLHVCGGTAVSYLWREPILEHVQSKKRSPKRLERVEGRFGEVLVQLRAGL